MSSYASEEEITSNFEIEEEIDDVVDDVIKRLTLHLLRKQNVNFGRLRSLTLLSENIHNKDSFAELIVLAFLKYLGINENLKPEARTDREAYVAFNHMNLNDETVNSYFCKFIIVLNPEIAASLNVVLSKLASMLSSRAKTRYTKDRIHRLERNINAIFESGEAEDIELEAPKNESLVEDPKPKIKRKVVKTGLLGFYGGSVQNGAQVRKSKHKRHSSSSSDVKSLSEPSSHSPDQGSILRIGRLNISNKPKGEVETAEETHRRLIGKFNRNTEVQREAIDDPLPSAQDIAKAKQKVRFEADEESSVGLI